MLKVDLIRACLPLISNKDDKLVYISTVHEDVLTLTCLFHQCSIQNFLSFSLPTATFLSPFIQIRTTQLLFACCLTVKSAQVLSPSHWLKSLPPDQLCPKLRLYTIPSVSLLQSLPTLLEDKTQKSLKYNNSHGLWNHSPGLDFLKSHSHMKS